MFTACGNNLYMDRGDYGIPLPFHVAAACEQCAADLEPEDTLVLTICRGDAEIVRQSWVWADVDSVGGHFILTLTQEEVARMPPGLYSWSLVLARDGVVRNTILPPGVLEVR